MNRPDNTVLTDDEIDDLCGVIASNTTMRAENERELVRDTIAAVIEKLGASDAVPVATVSGEVRRVCNGPGNYWNVGTILLCNDSYGATLDPSTNLYDATALAQARQQGRNEAVEAAIEAVMTLYEDDTPPYLVDLARAIDAARQPTQKES